MNIISIRIFAILVTSTAMAMSAVAALDRGGTIVDKMLWVAISVMVCLGSHLIPSITKARWAWLLWGFCLLGTIYSHITFLTYSSLRAGDERSKHSIQKADVERQIQITREALSSINARPIATVSEQLAITKGWRNRTKLQTELSEAKRAAALQDNLVMLASSATVTGVATATDVVTGRLAQVTGSNEASINLVTGLFYSSLVEFIGVFLWYQVFRHDVDHKLTSTNSVESNSLAVLELAVQTGKIKPTVKEIRVYLKCSQGRAMELHRTLKSKSINQ
jgi:hypothetical protein